MTSVFPAIETFLAQRKIAIVGVSDKRETGCNLAYMRFKTAGYQVYAVNPRISTFQGDPCYPDLAALPERPDAVFILTRPEVTAQIVAQCVALGIGHVWMHCMAGTKPGAGQASTSVSQSAVDVCRLHGINVIPGTCPNQFLNPDFGHKLMRGWAKLTGNLV